MNETQYNLRMSKDLKARLEQMAKERNRSLNNLIVTVLEAFASVELELVPTEIKGVVEPHYSFGKQFP